jgi:hypothetical protein
MLWLACWFVLFCFDGWPLVGTRLAPPGAVPPGGRPDPQVGRLFLCAHVIITPAELRFVHSQQACITYHLLSTPINFDFKRSSVGGDGGGWEALSGGVGGCSSVPTVRAEAQSKHKSSTKGRLQSSPGPSHATLYYRRHAGADPSFSPASAPFFEHLWFCNRQV